MKRKKYRRLQEWESEAVAQAYLDGEKLLAVAVEFDICESAVSRIGERRGFARRAYVGPRVSDMPPKPVEFIKLKRWLREKRKRRLEFLAAKRTSTPVL